MAKDDDSKQDAIRRIKGGLERASEEADDDSKDDTNGGDDRDSDSRRTDQEQDAIRRARRGLERASEKVSEKADDDSKDDTNGTRTRGEREVETEEDVKETRRFLSQREEKLREGRENIDKLISETREIEEERVMLGGEEMEKQEAYAALLLRRGKIEASLRDVEKNIGETEKALEILEIKEQLEERGDKETDSILERTSDGGGIPEEVPEDIQHPEEESGLEPTTGTATRDATEERLRADIRQAAIRGQAQRLREDIQEDIGLIRELEDVDVETITIETPEGEKREVSPSEAEKILQEQEEETRDWEEAQLAVAEYEETIERPVEEQDIGLEEISEFYFKGGLESGAATIEATEKLSRPFRAAVGDPLALREMTEDPSEVLTAGERGLQETPEFLKEKRVAKKEGDLAGFTLSGFARTIPGAAAIGATAGAASTGIGATSVGTVTGTAASTGAKAITRDLITMGLAKEATTGLEEIEEGKPYRGGARIANIGFGIAASMGASQQVQNYLKPSKFDVTVKAKTKTAGVEQGDEALVYTTSGGRRTPMQIQVQRPTLTGKQTLSGYGYTYSRGAVSGQQVTGGGEYGFGFPGTDVSVSGRQFSLAGQVTKTQFTPAGTQRFGYTTRKPTTTAELDLSISRLRGKQPYLSKSVQATGITKQTVKTPTQKILDTKVYAGDYTSTGKARIFRKSGLPSFKQLSTGGPAFDPTKGQTGGDGQGIVSLEGTFLDQTVETSATTASQVGGKLSLELLRADVAQTFTPPQIAEPGFAAATAPEQERRERPREAPKLEEVRRPRVDVGPTVAEGLDVGQVDEPALAVTPMERQDVSPVSRQRPGVGRAQTQQPATEQITSPTQQQETVTTPAVAQPSPLITPTAQARPPVSMLGTPPLPDLDLGFRQTSKTFESQQKPTEDAYRPSLGGVLFGETTPEVPSETFTGLELRPMVKGDSNGDQTEAKDIITPSGEI